MPDKIEEKGLVRMSLCCGSKEFKTREEADLFIEEFNQREKERQEEALYYWHGISIKDLVRICLDMGVKVGISICNNENDDDVKKVSFILIEEMLNKIMQILSSRFSPEGNTTN